MCIRVWCYFMFMSFIFLNAYVNVLCAVSHNDMISLIHKWICFVSTGTLHTFCVDLVILGIFLLNIRWFPWIIRLKFHLKNILNPDELMICL